MSRLVSRILLAVLMFPLATVCYIALLVISETMNRTNAVEVFIIDNLVTWAGVAIYWTLIWRSSVRWNGSRIGFTLAAVPATAIVGTIIGSLTYGFVRQGMEDFATFIGGTLAIILWLISTLFIWRETAAERMARIKAAGASALACPTCGYNLTGLRESRCPECGAQFTLDELMAAQRDQSHADLE